MRLIDADRVMQSIDMQMIKARELLSNDPQSQEFVSIAEQSFKQEISNAPTVNAIPVEWIDGYIKRRVNDAEIYAEILFISDMVTEWEKENAEVSD